jgi:hypothetical protein
MPYIKQTRREELLSKMQDLLLVKKNQGDLNYIISKILHSHLLSNGCNYATCNDIIGVLECAKLEFYRKIVSPYEDTKILENGDL